MDVETEIEVYGETAVWVECDVCGRAFGGRCGNAIIVSAMGNLCIGCTEVGKKVTGYQNGENPICL